MKLIFVGLGMVWLYDVVVEGKVFGVVIICDFFCDDIYLMDVGFYYVVMIYYVMLIGKSLVGLFVQFDGVYGFYLVVLKDQVMVLQ